MTNVAAGWNWFDWMLAGILLLSTVRALLRGFVQALFGLAGLVCGFMLAGWKDRDMTVWVMHMGWLRSPEVARVVCYAVILSGVAIVFGVAGSVARKTAHAAGLGIVDRLLGGVVGAARGVLVGAALVLMVKAVVPKADMLRDSQLSSYFLAASHAVSFVVPHALR